MMASIQLHNQGALQQEVHISDAVDVDLRFHPDAGLAEIRPGEGLQQGFGSAVHPVKDLSGAAISPPGESVAQEPDCHVAPADGALHHDQGFSERQASQRVDEHVTERSNRAVGVRLEEQSVVPGLPLEGCTASVMHMERTGGVHMPEPVEGRRAAAREELPVPQQRHLVRSRRRERVETPDRLQDAGPHRPPQCRVVDSQAGHRRPPGRSPADRQGPEDIHGAIVSPATRCRESVDPLCGHLHVTRRSVLRPPAP